MPAGTPPWHRCDKNSGLFVVCCLTSKHIRHCHRRQIIPYAGAFEGLLDLAYSSFTLP